MPGEKRHAELHPANEDPNDDAPPRHATWLTASQLIIADVIGIGVMAMAEAFAELGWVLAVTCCALMLPLNQVSGLMVWETIVDVYPQSLSLADLASNCLGKTAYWTTFVLVYSFIFMTLGDYLLSLGLCLQMIFPDLALPAPVWTLLAAAVLLPFCQVRTLNAAAVLLWINSATIVLSVGLCLGYLISEGADASLARSGGKTYLVAEGLGWQQFTSGVSKMAFAYVGVMMYPEIILEMQQPRDFPKAFYAGAPFQLGAFMTVGCVGYRYLGDAAHGLLINAVPPGAISRTCAGSLFVHLVITYLIKGTVLTRCAHRYVSPATVNDRTYRGAAVWASLTSSVMLLCLGVALAVPFFDDLTSLIGSLQTPVVGFCIPVVFYVCGRQKRGRTMSAALWAALSFLFLFGLLFCIFGTTATVLSIASRWQTEPPESLEGPANLASLSDSYNSDHNNYNSTSNRNYYSLESDSSSRLPSYAVAHAAAARAHAHAHAHMYSPRLLHTQSWHHGNATTCALLWALDASSGHYARAATAVEGGWAAQGRGTEAAEVGGGGAGRSSALIPT